MLFNGGVNLNAPGSGITSDFFTFRYASPHSTNIRATSIPGETYNVGFTTNGVTVGSLVKQYISSPGLTRTLSAAEGDVHGARASTYSTTGRATMLITYE